MGSKCIPANLRFYREKAGLNQKLVAGILNMDRSTYSNYETGKTQPNIDTLEALTILYNVPVETLIKENRECTKKTKARYIKLTDENTLLAYYRLLSSDQRNYILSLLECCLQENSQREEKLGLSADPEAPSIHSDF